MGHDVFISYSSKDKPTADACCATLERGGIRCWMAPRDILPGAEWGGAIVEAIEGSRVMVLVFSSHANESQQIRREVERAVSKGVAIIPFRIEDVTPGGSLEYFLSTPHWLDAITPPLERHLQYLAETIGALLQGPGAAAREPAVRPVAPARPARPIGVTGLQRRTLVAIAAAAGLLLAIALVWASAGGRGSGGGETASIDPGLIASWKADALLSGTSQSKALQLMRDGEFKLATAFDETGTIRPEEYATTFVNSAGKERYSSWVFADGAMPRAGELAPEVLNYHLLGSRSSADWLAAFSVAEWTHEERPLGAPASGPDRWTLEITLAGQAWTMTFELRGYNYVFHAEAADKGAFTASGGKWKMVSEATGIAQGDYQLIDRNTLVLAEAASMFPTQASLANTTFKRVAE